ncbi:sterol desaturase family protein [SAR86 cluster bacterium]|jgi:alkylglycerol monooxygenase|nr:sterol desaturase family protein [SAR86 cluster bacterium]
MHTSDLIAYAAPIFTFMIFCEFVYGYFKNRNNYRLNDTFTSISLGMMSRFPVYLQLGVQGIVYAFIWNQFNLGLLNSYTPLTWILAFVLYDLSYYWLHRCHHEIKFLWASHVVHHHGEEFNLSTALRQTGTDFIFKWVFYTPMLFLGVPPEIFVTVAALNLIYQFWVHTEHIDRLGFLDYIFVTPSNHRIHHAQNKEYIDANYGGVFIIWDIIFGTFKDERKELKPIYGTSKPLKSWNPFWANFEVWTEIFKDTWRTKSWKDKFKVWISRPKWRPKDVSEKFPIQKNDLREFKKYDPKVTLFAKIFGFGQLVFGSFYSQSFFFNVSSMGTTEIFLIGVNITMILVFASLLFEGKGFGYHLEFARAILVLLAIYFGQFEFMQLTVLIHAIICALLAGYMAVSNKTVEFNEARSES